MLSQHKHKSVTNSIHLREVNTPLSSSIFILPQRFAFGNQLGRFVALCLSTYLVLNCGLLLPFCISIHRFPDIIKLLFAFDKKSFYI